ncbi:hypothetical protein KIW84_061255 [Lathyrus oleraceus]|uniref:Uncharacterized protein n=1 Tax=Pisum sativum TaxID=3888 RepID=A0A9D5A6I5_PEA|nr:hypothetical protein KIW84_061255 [Pisum sativum]
MAPNHHFCRHPHQKPPPTHQNPTQFVTSHAPKCNCAAKKIDDDDEPPQPSEPFDSPTPPPSSVDESEHHLSMNALNGSHGAGAPWLKTLGPHIADYNALSIKFYVKDTFVTLFGEKHKGPIPAQFHHIKRLHNTKAIEASFTLQFQEIHPATGFDPTGLHPDLTAILHSFHDVFAEPQGLPPARFHDHAIPLVQGSNLVKPFMVCTLESLGGSAATHEIPFPLC